METSLKFQKIEDNLFKLLLLLVSNKNIAKYIYWLTDNPLIEPDVTTDLIDNGYILPTLFDSQALTEEKVRVFLNPISGSLEGIPLGDIMFSMEIVVPSSKWNLKGIGKYRAYRIVDEFSKMVDGKDIAGVGNVNIVGFKTSLVSGKNYFCLSIGIKVRSLTVQASRTD